MVAFLVLVLMGAVGCICYRVGTSDGFVRGYRTGYAAGYDLGLITIPEPPKMYAPPPLVDTISVRGLA